MSKKNAAPFWMTTPLNKMTPAQWESLCDGCGKCCLHKLYNEEADELTYTNVVCRLMDVASCRCSSYADRLEHVPDCVVLSAYNLERLFWMPSTCAYRLLNEGKTLPEWHPLVCGDPDRVHTSGNSIQYKAVSEERAGPLEHHVVDWWD